MEAVPQLSAAMVLQSTPRGSVGLTLLPWLHYVFLVLALILAYFDHRVKCVGAVGNWLHHGCVHMHI